MMKSSIFLKAYHCHDGRKIHYAAARLHKDQKSQTTTILDMDDDSVESSNIACWVFFYPMGPNRRILDAVVSHYALNFQCDNDVLFLCVNRPGKGGTSSFVSSTYQHQTTAPSEREHVLTSLNDIVTILDHYGISKTNLIYMCAGSTYAYSFASQFPGRTTGHIIGIASWVLRSQNIDGSDSRNDIKTPQMHSLTHRMAMSGWLGPKWLVSNLVGGIVGSVSVIFSSIPPALVGKQLKKGLSHDEILKFDEKYPNGVDFVGMMKWIHNDGCDEEISVIVNGDDKTAVDNEASSECNKKEADAREIAVCLSTQQDLGLIYKTSIPSQQQVLLWHGENDKMISIAGAEYLESMIPNAKLNRIKEGTHQGVMFFFPDDVMDALNNISRCSSQHG